MPGIKLDDLKKQLDWYSNAVSTSVRTTAFGVIAAIWAVFTADGISISPTSIFGIETEIAVKLAFVFAGGALLTDILQYVAVYWMTNIGVDNWELAQSKKKQVEFYYDRANLGMWGLILYNVSFILFPCKLILAILSAVAFVFLAFSVTFAAP